MHFEAKTNAIFAISIIALFLFGCLQGNRTAQAVASPSELAFNAQVVAVSPSVSAGKAVVQDIKCKGCNVLVVSFDALQAAHTGHLGYKAESGRDVTPGLDAVASEGFSFSNDISAAPWTVPSYMSWFTSTYPSQHKLVNKYVRFVNATDNEVSNFSKLSPNMTTMAEFFKSQGFITGAFTGDAGVSAVFGYNEGFDVFYDKVAFGGFDYSEPLAEQWLKNNSGKKFFMFLHSYGAHGQNEPNYAYKYVDFNYTGIYNGSKFQQRDLREQGLAQGQINLTEEDVRFWRAIYDEKISLVDAEFQNFLEFLDTQGLLNNTLIVISSDHGTEFFEHERFDHGHTLYDELVRVPLVFKIPGVKGGKIIASQVRSIDILPTILDILDVAPGEQLAGQMEGTSLAPLISGEKSDLNLTAFIETDYRQYTYKRGIRTPDGWKFVYSLEDGSTELYNLKSDPKETKNLAAEQPRIAYELEQTLFAHLKKLERDPYGSWIVGCVPVYGDQCKNQGPLGPQISTTSNSIKPKNLEKFLKELGYVA